MLRSAKPFVCCDRLEDSRTCVPIRFWNSSQNLDVNMRSRSLTGTNFFLKKFVCCLFSVKNRMRGGSAHGLAWGVVLDGTTREFGYIMEISASVV